MLNWQAIAGIGYTGMRKMMEQGQVSAEFEVPCMNAAGHIQARGLYNPENEHDSCGVGFVVSLDPKPRHDVVGKAIRVLMNHKSLSTTARYLHTQDEQLTTAVNGITLRFG